MIVVLEDRFERALFDRAHQPNRIDQRRVVQLVADDDVALLAQRRKDRLVRVPARHKRVARFDAQELGDRGFEPLVRRERATDKPHAGRPRPKVAQALDPRLDHLGVVGQPQVVIGTKTQAVPDRSVRLPHAHAGAHRPFEHLQVLVLPVLSQRFENLVGPNLERQ